MKEVSVSQSLIWFGSLFHNLGAAFWKALSPYDFVLVLFSHSRLDWEDLSDLTGEYFTKREARYGGARPLRHRYVRVMSLKIILCFTGNQ